MKRLVRQGRGEVDQSAFAAPILVTGMVADPKRAGRLAVEVNRVELGVIAIDLVADRGIRPGLELTRAQLDELLREARRTRLLDKALDLLAVRARSARDLRIRLRRVEGSDDDIAWVMGRLTAQGFLDDAAYARTLARGRMIMGGVSRRRVEAELRRRGVAPETAADAIRDTMADVDFDEFGAALGAARRRSRALASLDEHTRRRRLYAWLARRGYQPDIIQRVLRELTASDADSE